MKRNSMRTSSSHSGFTLVEIMVGLAIGLVLTLVIMQVSTVFEAQKRATTGTSDAQTNGSIALYNIGRDLQMAGYPMLPVTDSPLECATLTVGGVADNPIPTLSPVVITQGVAGTGVSASDTITIRYGDTAMGGVPVQLTAVPAASVASAAPAQDATVTSNLGCKANDTILITNASACSMTKVKAIPALPNTTTITFADADATKTAATAANAVVGANLACFGNWNTITYAVSGGNLQRNGTDSVAGIVNIQAQYGISAAGSSNTITNWVNATGTWVTPSVTDRNRIKAVRIAIVARNSKIEPAAVTTACSSINSGPATGGAQLTGLCAWEGNATNPAPTIDLSPGDPNWASYRYRVFETIIPLRNVIWAKGTLP